MDRRQFCISTAISVVCCATADALAAAVASSEPLPRVPLDKVIFDSRFAQSRSYGAEKARAGYRTAAFRGDLTALWLHELAPAWAAGGGAVAGMTTAPALFCLEQLAKDYWKRVVVRVDHPPVVPGVGLVSWIIR